jgi:hypothetical protein
MKIKKALLSILAISAVSSFAFAAPQDEYIIKVLMDQTASGATGTTPTEPEVTAPEGAPDEWLDYFHKKGQLYEIDSLDLWGPKMRSVFLVNKGIKNADMPQKPFGVTSVGYLDLRSNALTNIEFMRGVNSITYSFDVSFNPGITDLSPLSGISIINGGLFRLEGLSITNLNGLENLQFTSDLHINGNPKLTDISALSSLKTSKNVWVDSPTQYKVKPKVGSPFCNGLDTGSISARNINGGAVMTSAMLCQP